MQSKEDIWNLKVPDVTKAGGIPLMIRYSRLQEKYGWPITFISGSILNRVGYIAGVEKMCCWMLKKPELVYRLARVVADFHIAVAQYWVDTFGHPGGFAFGPSCELPPKAPPYNVWVMRKAINDFGWYE